MMVLTPNDLRPLIPDLDEEATRIRIDDALAEASLVAPCLEDLSKLSPTQLRQLKAVLRAVVLRWTAAGAAGNVTTQSGTAGPYHESVTVDNTQERRGMFWPSEITMLEAICKNARRSGTVDVTRGLSLSRRDIELGRFR
ncbi:MAG: hypothetical protein FWG15_02810 [Propionibacteriaceae bacterium]|nr:hypothetical protein [Propionibacteriaceae bacterium]